MHAILFAKSVWAAVNNTDVAEKEQTTSIMTRKYRVDMEICCDGGGAVDVLGPSVAVGAGGAGDSLMIIRIVDD